MPPPQRQQSANQIVHQRQELKAYQGPVPPPEQLEHFERVLPGLADRIMALAEGHARNRWRNDRANRVVSILGQVFAFVVVMTLIVGGIYLAATGLQWQGLATIAGTLAAVVWAFRRSTKKANG